MAQHHSYETERLIIRPTSVEDATFIRTLFNTPKWIANIGDRQVHSDQEAVIYIREKMLPQFERLGFSNNTMIRKSDGAKVGSCGLYDREGLDGIDIGYALLPEYEGNGYAVEASLCMKKAAFEEHGLSKLSAITLPENTSSRKLLEKLGMQFIRMVNLPGDPADLMLYEITQDK